MCEVSTQVKERIFSPESDKWEYMYSMDETDRFSFIMVDKEYDISDINFYFQLYSVKNI